MKYGAFGETHTLEEWSEISGVPATTICKRVRNNKWTLEKALTTKGLRKRDSGVGRESFEPTKKIMVMQWNYDRRMKIERDTPKWVRPKLKKYKPEEVVWVQYTSRSGRYESVKKND